MTISLITAFDPNQVIGYQNQLPWHLPEDLQYFKQITSHKTVVMGRKTFESIGKPLPNRHNIVVSTSLSLKEEHGLTVVTDPKHLIQRHTEPLFIIGGARIYEFFLPHAQKLYITHIQQPFPGDCQFPPIPWEEWQLVSQTPIKSYRGINYTFAIYQRHPSSTDG